MIRANARTPTKRFALLTFAFLAAVPAACASAPKPRPTAIDPANPAAPEAPPLGVAALGGPAPTPSTPAPTKPDEETPPARGPDAPTTYTCPMHPEVTTTRPGRCPICGMNLVPKKPAEGRK